MQILHFWNKFLLGGFDEHMAFGGGKREGVICGYYIGSFFAIFTFFCLVMKIWWCKSKHWKILTCFFYLHPYKQVMHNDLQYLSIFLMDISFYLFSNNRSVEIRPFSQNEQYMHNAILGSNHLIIYVPTTCICLFKYYIIYNPQTY